MYLINGFGRASPGFSLDPPTGSGQAWGSLHPISDTILDLVSELGPLPAKRPRAPRIRRVLHPSAPSAPLAPSAPFEIAQDPIDQQVVYSKHRPNINIKTSSCGTH